MTTDLEHEADPYSQLPELYDLEHADVADDLDLYLQLAEVVGDPILELGAGTGRLLIPFALAGHRVTGVDRSHPMLERANAAILEAGIGDLVTLHQTDMTNLAAVTEGPFGLAIFSLNGFMHLTTPKEQRAALSAVKNVLDPRGMLVIDVLNPTPELLAVFDGRVRHEGTWTRESGEDVARFAARNHYATTQTILTELWFDLTSEDGSVSRVRTSFPMRYVHRSELELMLELAGFVEWKVYGSYDLDPYDDACDRLIVLAEVTPSAGR